MKEIQQGNLLYHCLHCHYFNHRHHHCHHHHHHCHHRHRHSHHLHHHSHHHKIESWIEEREMSPQSELRGIYKISTWEGVSISIGRSPSFIVMIIVVTIITIILFILFIINLRAPAGQNFDLGRSLPHHHHHPQDLIIIILFLYWSGNTVLKWKISVILRKFWGWGMRGSRDHGWWKSISRAGALGHIVGVCGVGHS